MKKLLLILACLFVPVFFASQAMAAASITCTDYTITGVTGGKEIRFITYTVTFGAAHEEPTNTAMDDVTITTSVSPTRASVAGWWLMEVDIIPGTTGPTADTDFYLYRPAAASGVPGWGTLKIDVLGGNGVDSIDNATISTFNPATTTRPLTGKEILSFANEAVANATCTIVFTLYR